MRSAASTVLYQSSRWIDLSEIRCPLDPIGSKFKDFIQNLQFGSLRIVRDDFHEATPQTLGNRDPEKVAELAARIREFTGAVVFDAESGFLYHNNLVIQFYLDETGQMIGYTVKMDAAV